MLTWRSGIPRSSEQETLPDAAAVAAGTFSGTTGKAPARSPGGTGCETIRGIHRDTPYACRERKMTTEVVSSAAGDSLGTNDLDPRRSFIGRTVALAVGLMLYVPAALAGAWALLNPLREKAAAGRFVRLTTLESLPSDGTPQRFAVIADRTDAWTHYPQEPVGAVYLRKVGAKEVQAMQVVCPHAGCFVAYEPQKNIFFCPCHAASFELDGKRKDSNSPSPRDLDGLPVEIRNNSEVWVKFQKYRIGTPQQIVEA